MESIPLICSDRKITEFITNILNTFSEEQVKITSLPNADNALEYMAIELPDLMIINFDDPAFSGYELLERISCDDWLHNTGIIALCESSQDVEKIENLQNVNTIMSLTISETEFHLKRILTIIFNNRRIIFQKTISKDLINNISGCFTINNDPYVARCYANIICNFLYTSKKLTHESKFNLKLALNEMMLNSIEHGNCGITYDEKTEWMEEHFDIYQLVNQRLQTPAIASRKVTIEYFISSNNARFVITDEGNGFDWKNFKCNLDDENLLMLHGRGILMTRAVVENFTFNEKGNQVSFDIKFDDQNAPRMPDFFQDVILKNFNPGDKIFNQGENSDFLYYIVEGRYQVLANDTVVSTLTPDDIFMGEMSFLLNNQRSASVVAETKGKLIQISKKQFVEAIKKQPQYALFLCRLLAQRIQRSNQRK